VKTISNFKNENIIQFVEAGCLFALLFSILIVSSLDFALTWDESIYFNFSDSIKQWFFSGAPISEESLNKFWAYNTYLNPHPPFMKILGAVSSHYLNGILSFPTTYRAANFVYIAGCITLAYRLILTIYPAWASLTAISFIFLQPILFGYMILATTDSPVAVSWLVLVLIGWRICETDNLNKKRILWVLFYLIFGFATATKITGFLAIIPITAYFLYKKKPIGALFISIIWALIFLAAVSPEMWHHPVKGIAQYLLYPFTRSSIPVPTVYFGEVYEFQLPWHYFFVTSLITFPVLLWYLLIGIVLKRKDDTGMVKALLFPFGFWIVLVNLPFTPKHDGVRQFLSLFPILALLSWNGLLVISGLIKKRKPAWNYNSILKISSFLSMIILAVGVYRSHPFELSYYNCLIGGIKGAEKMGMELTLYFEAVNHSVVVEISKTVKESETLLISPYWATLIHTYRKHGLIKNEFIIRGDTEIKPDYMLISRRRFHIDDDMYRKITAIKEVKYNGVSLVKFAKYQ